MPRRPAPVPLPPPPPEGIKRTRYYMHTFINTLRECGHKPEHVREVLRELACACHGTGYLLDRPCRFCASSEGVEAGTPAAATQGKAQ